jgi:hypothetical protein
MKFYANSKPAACKDIFAGGDVLTLVVVNDVIVQKAVVGNC